MVKLYNQFESTVTVKALIHTVHIYISKKIPLIHTNRPLENLKMQDYEPGVKLGFIDTELWRQ